MNHNVFKATELSALPIGKMLCVKIENFQILLANVDGTIYAVADLCPHEDISLATGSLHGDCVKCPLHGSRFDLKTGAALEEPAEDALATYPVHIKDDLIFIELPQ